MNYEKAGKALIITGTAFTIFFGAEFIFNTTKLKSGEQINPAIWANYGDIVGGFVGTIFALVGVFLLFETLREQRKIYIKQQVETRFFELLKLYRDNVAEIESKGNKGRQVFIEIKDEFHELHDFIKDLYEPYHTNLTKAEHNKKLVQIAYLLTFFGVNNSSTEYLKQRTQEVISNDEIYKRFEEIYLKFLSKDHERTKEENKHLPPQKRSYLKYDGHQSRLGHYYRHLFQTVKYVNQQNLIDYSEKYNYIKTLRAQLGTHDQALLLYNAVSPLGEPWELDATITNGNDKLITKYNLIKNIPYGFTRDVNPKDYFPNVYFEVDKTPPPTRQELEAKYT